MMRTIVFFITLLSLFSAPLSAAARTDAAMVSLSQQLQLITLVEQNPVFSHYQQRLISDIEQSKLTLSKPELAEITTAIADFWLKRGIAIREASAIHHPELLIAAMALEPEIEGYLELNNRIRYLMWLAQQHSWRPIPFVSLLEPGVRDPSIPEITERLMWLRDYTAVYSDEGREQVQLYDDALKDAVMRFQWRHGLKQDGIIGPHTLNWLNRTPIERARLLAFNFIERAQYMAHIGTRYLLINIPAYEMVLVDDAQVALRSKVIVGKPYRQTPIFQGEISNLVLNPSWNVPRRLVKYDLLPKVRQDGSYLSRFNFQAFNYNGELVTKTPEEWSSVARGRFPYRLVQKPGEGNTLGRYKFFFANPYSVYLHDTTDKELFDRDDRALSSGCIRIEKVEQLANWMASYLVSDKQTWVDMQFERDKTQWFAFDHKLPIHLVYWTSWLDNQNIAQFRDDIYNRNQNITTQLHASN